MSKISDLLNNSTDWRDLSVDEKKNIKKTLDVGLDSAFKELGKIFDDIFANAEKSNKTKTCSCDCEHDDPSILVARTTPYKSDAVDHPKHYQGNKFEVIDIIEDYKLGFNLGNAIKYILRAGHKDDYKQDLKKAIWYLNREVNN